MAQVYNAKSYISFLLLCECLSKRDIWHTTYGKRDSHLATRFQRVIDPGLSYYDFLLLLALERTFVVYTKHVFSSVSVKVVDVYFHFGE